jgi:hypothetical protein
VRRTSRPFVCLIARACSDDPASDASLRQVAAAFVHFNLESVLQDLKQPRFGVNAADVLQALETCAHALAAALDDDDEAHAQSFVNLQGMLCNVFHEYAMVSQVERVQLAASLMNSPVNLCRKLIALTPKLRRLSTLTNVLKAAMCFVSLNAMEGGLPERLCGTESRQLVDAVFARVVAATVPELRAVDFMQLVELQTAAESILRTTMSVMDASEIIYKYRFVLAVKLLRCSVLEYRLRGVDDMVALSVCAFDHKVCPRALC